MLKSVEKVCFGVLQFQMFYAYTCCREEVYFYSSLWYFDNRNCQGRIQLFILSRRIQDEISVYHQNNGIHYKNLRRHCEKGIIR